MYGKYDVSSVGKFFKVFLKITVVIPADIISTYVIKLLNQN